MTPIDSAGLCEDRDCNKLARNQVRDLEEVRPIAKVEENPKFPDLHRSFRTISVHYLCDDHLRNGQVRCLDGSLKARNKDGEWVE